MLVSSLLHDKTGRAGFLEQGMDMLDKARNNMGRYMNSLSQPADANGQPSYAQVAATPPGRTVSGALASPGVAVSR